MFDQIRTGCDWVAPVSARIEAEILRRQKVYLWPVFNLLVDIHVLKKREAVFVQFHEPVIADHGAAFGMVEPFLVAPAQTGDTDAHDLGVLARADNRQKPWD